MRHRGRPPHPDILTPKEWEVLSLLREGLTNRQIADRLGVTRDGVKYHVAQILTKLGVHTREEAAAWRPEPAPVAAPVRAGLSARLTGVGRLGLIGSAGALLCGLAALGGVIAYAELGGGGDSGSSALDASRGGPPSPTAVAESPPTASPVASPVVAASGEGALGTIAYVKGGNLWTLDLDTGEDSMLVERTVAMTYGTTAQDLTAFDPEWSADGEWVAFGINNSAIDYRQCQIARASDGLLEFVGGGPIGRYGWEWSPTDLLLSASGTQYRPVGSFPADYAHYADVDTATNVGFGEAKWSLDGSQLAVGGATVTYVGDKGEQEASPPYEVYLVDPNAPRPTFVLGQQPQGLTAVYRSDTGPGAPIVQSWSPDGKYVMFWDGPADSGVAQLTIQPVNNTAKIKTTRPGPLVPSAASWSPDGSHLAFVGADPAAGGARTASLMVFANDGSATWANQEEWGRKASAMEPSWSSDSQHLAFVEAGHIWAEDANGDNPQQLTTDDLLTDRYPQWSADGSHILFVRLKTDAVAQGVPGPAELWLMNSDGSDQHKLGDLPAIDPATQSKGGFVDWGQYFSWYRPHGVAPMETAPEPSISPAPGYTYPPNPPAPTGFFID